MPRRDRKTWAIPLTIAFTIALMGLRKIRDEGGVEGGVEEVYHCMGLGIIRDEEEKGVGWGGVGEGSIRAFAGVRRARINELIYVLNVLRPVNREGVMSRRNKP